MSEYDVDSNGWLSSAILIIYGRMFKSPDAKHVSSLLPCVKRTSCILYQHVLYFFTSRSRNR